MGAGFVVGEDRVITCAHVVQEALGLDSGARPSDGDLVALDFPLAQTVTATTATVLRWEPIDDDGRGDVAVLGLSELVPPGVAPASFVAGAQLWDHTFRAFGFPRSSDDGVWAWGVLRDVQGTGWVQMESRSVHVVEAGFSGSAVWDDQLGGVVGMAVAQDAGNGGASAYLIPAAALLSSLPDETLNTVPPSPYRGLKAFGEADRHLFFGRDALTQSLLGHVEVRSFVAVVGASGSGKSSLVFAGLLPRLPGSWLVATLRPSDAERPVLSLAAALLPLLQPGASPLDRVTELPRLERALLEGRLDDAVREILGARGAARLVIVVDQFEELLGADDEGADAFRRVLFDGVDAQDKHGHRRLAVVITVRADFLGKALEDSRLSELTSTAAVLVGAMNATELVTAIEGPLPPEVAFEEGLVHDIIEHLGGGPGRLPLLQFALTLLWERQERGRITRRAYADIGRVDGALTAYAEQVYAAHAADAGEETARRLFVQLVRPSPSGTSVRRVARRGDFDEATWDLGRSLADDRLLVTDKDETGVETIELVHEALITNWDRLRRWVADDLEFRTWQEELRTRLQGWQRDGEDPSGLLRGVELTTAGAWLGRRRSDVGEQEADFVRRSLERQRLSHRRRRSRRAAVGLLALAAAAAGGSFFQQAGRLDEQTRLATARALATAAEQREGTRPDLAMLLAGAAERLGGTEESSDAVLRLATAYDEAELMLAPDVGPIVALSFSPVDEERLAVVGAEGFEVWDVRTRTLVHEAELDGVVADASFAPDGQSLVIQQYTDGGERIAVHPAAGGERTAFIGAGQEDFAADTLFISPDGQRAATCGSSGTRVYDLRAMRALAAMPDADPCPVGFTEDGRLLAVGSDRTLTRSVFGGPFVPGVLLPPATRSEDLPDEELAEYSFSGGSVSPDGRHLTYGDNFGGIATVDLRTGKAAPAALDDVTSEQVAAYSWAGSNALFRGSSDVAYQVASLETGAVTAEYTVGVSDDSSGPDEGTQAISRNAEYFAAANGAEVVAVGRPSRVADRDSVRAAEPDDRRSRLIAATNVLRQGYEYGTAEGSSPMAATLPQGGLVDLSKDGRYVGWTACSGGSGSACSADGGLGDAVRVHDVNAARAEAIEVGRHDEELVDLRFDPTSRFLASAGPHDVKVWSLEDRTLSWAAPVHDVVSTVSVSPGGDLVATTGGTDGSAVSLHRRDGTSEALGVAGFAATFSPDGRWLALLRRDALTVWDLVRRRTATSIEVEVTQFGYAFGYGGSAGSGVLFDPSGEHVTAPDGSGYGVWAVADGRRVGSVVADALLDFSATDTVTVFDHSRVVDRFVRPGQVLPHLCSITAGAVTDDEWDAAAGPDVDRPCD